MSTSSQILKIFIFRLLSMVVGFGSLLVVVPYITTDPERYAIYAVILSLSLFLTYGDLGFLSACQKYCAEAVGRNSILEETKFLGFTVNLLIIVFSIFAILMIFAAFNPLIVIPGLDEKNAGFASKMFVASGLLLPIQVIGQRLILLILSTRLKDYLFYRVDIFFNLAKIAIAPLFLRESEFLLLEYYVVTILLSVTSCLITFFIIRIKIKFSLVRVFKNLRFSRKIFNKIKKLALSMFISTLCWILYYEMDLIIAAQFFSIMDVAYYAVAFTFLNFIRSLCVLGFAPFLPLMNNYYGSGMINEAKNISSSLIVFTIPLFIILSLILGKHMDQILIYWLGSSYLPTADIINFLLFGIVLVGFNNVAAHYMTTFKLYRSIIIFGIGPVLVYYGVFSFLMYFLPEGGISNLAYAKALSGLTASFMGIYLMVSNDVIDLRLVVRTIFFSMLGVIGFIYMPSLISFDLFNSEPNIKALVLLLISLGLLIMGIFIVSMLLFRSSRSLLLQLLTALTRAVKI